MHLKCVHIWQEPAKKSEVFVSSSPVVEDNDDVSAGDVGGTYDLDNLHIDSEDELEKQDLNASSAEKATTTASINLPNPVDEVVENDDEDIDLS